MFVRKISAICIAGLLLVASACQTQIVDPPETPVESTPAIAFLNQPADNVNIGLHYLKDESDKSIPITAVEEHVVAFTWNNADGTLYFCIEKSDATEFYAREADGNIVLLHQYPGLVEPDIHFHPALNAILFASGSRMRLLDVNSGLVEPLLADVGILQIPVFAGSGQRIAFWTFTTTPIIGLVRSDGSEYYRLPPLLDIHYTGRLRWSPDERYLALDARNDSAYFAIVDLAAHRVDYIAAGGDPRWSPDGQSLLFASAGEDGVRKLFILDVASHSREQVSILPNSHFMPRWINAHQIAFLYDDYSGSGMEIYQQNLETGMIERRSDFSGAGSVKMFKVNQFAN